MKKLCLPLDVKERIEATRKLEHELASTRADCERLQARKDELEEMLEKRVQQGALISPSTRVLHFRYLNIIFFPTLVSLGGRHIMWKKWNTKNNIRSLRDKIVLGGRVSLWKLIE